jgi:hypothetical protein
MSDTPRTLEALTQVLDCDGRLEDDNAPFVLVRLAKTLERELTKANAELAAMKKVIRKIYYETETYADGAPDATNHDKLCNDISSQLEPFIK